MNRWIFGLAAGLIAASLSPAEAKSLNMGSISRSDISSACNRAGGTAFGIGNLSRAYGCSTPVGEVYCTAEGICGAVVSDTLPLTGNSLDFVLTRGQNKPASVMVRPVDSRIVPIQQP
jgi:hypothetical protein